MMMRKKIIEVEEVTGVEMMERGKMSEVRDYSHGDELL